MSLRNIALVFCVKPRNLVNYNKRNDKQNKIVVFACTCFIAPSLLRIVLRHACATKKIISRNSAQ